MSLQAIPRRPLDLVSECALSYNADEVLEVGHETARSGQLLTASRGSAGRLVDLYGQELVVPSHAPRLSAFDDGLSSAVNGEGPPRRVGRLLEPGRTNAFTYSQDLSNAVWTKNAATVALATVLGPDNKTATYKLAETNAAGVKHGVSRATPTLTNSVRSAFSFAVRAAERTWIYITTTDKAGTARRTWVNLATGAVGTKNSGHVLWIRYRRDGWYRVGVSFDAATGATAPSVEVNTATGDNVQTFTGVTGSGVYLTDLQFETDGRYPTSFVATVAAAVARSADDCDITHNLLPLPTTFSVFVEFARPNHADIPDGTDIGSFPFLWHWGAVGGNRMGCYFNITTRTITAFIELAGGTVVQAARAIPSNRQLRILAQFQALTTAGQVRLDVNDGAGFTAWSGAIGPFSTLSSYTLALGCLGDGGADVLGAELLALRFYRGHRTITEMLRTR